MDDFIFLPEKFAGYPLTLAEARQRLHKDRWALKDFYLLSAEELKADNERTGVFMRRELAISQLHSFAQSPTSGAWYRIPAGYWIDHRKGMDHMLRDWLKGELPQYVTAQPYLTAMPAEIIGAPIVVWRDDIDRILAELPATAEALWDFMQTVIAWKKGESGADTAASDGTARLGPIQPDRDALIKSIAATFDATGVPVREVKKPAIKGLWPSEAGPAPIIKEITRFMEGGSKGRPRSET
jgi:hypothetical protein